MRTALLVAAAALCLTSGCTDSAGAGQPAAPELPAIDVSAMTKDECEAVRRMSLNGGASQAEVDRRVNCAGAR